MPAAVQQYDVVGAQPLRTSSYDWSLCDTKHKKCCLGLPSMHWAIRQRCGFCRVRLMVRVQYAHETWDHVVVVGLPAFSRDTHHHTKSAMLPTKSQYREDLSRISLALLQYSIKCLPRLLLFAVALTQPHLGLHHTSCIRYQRANANNVRPTDFGRSQLALQSVHVRMAHE